MLRKRTVAIGAAGLVAACGAALLLFPGGERGGRLRVLFSGETLGELEQCDCGEVPAGGLPFRGTYIGRPPPGFLLVDVGCVGTGARDFEVLRAEAVLRAMRRMGYCAVNIGEHELWLGLDGLQRLRAVGVQVTRPLEGSTVMPAGPP